MGTNWEYMLANVFLDFLSRYFGLKRTFLLDFPWDIFDKFRHFAVWDLLIREYMFRMQQFKDVFLEFVLKF